MVMYNNKLAGAIKVNNKVLREFKDTVYLAFGSEYSIYLKNLSTVRALINVFVDGDNIVPGGLVLNAGQEIELERSIKNGNMNEGNKLKFIERIGAIEQHRGIKLEDGLVRVEYQFEKVYTYTPNVVPNTPWILPMQPHHYWYGSYHIDCFGSAKNDDVICSSMTSDPSRGVFGRSQAMNAVNHMAVCRGEISQNSAQASMPQTETGITVAGSKSEQKFHTASWFATEPTVHSFILKLLGETAENKLVRTPVTTKTSVVCSSCHQKSKASAAFCPRCGTSLKLFA